MVARARAEAMADAFYDPIDGDAGEIAGEAQELLDACRRAMRQEPCGRGEEERLLDLLAHLVGALCGEGGAALAGACLDALETAQMMLAAEAMAAGRRRRECMGRLAVRFYVLLARRAPSGAWPRVLGSLQALLAARVAALAHGEARRPPARRGAGGSVEGLAGILLSPHLLPAQRAPIVALLWRVKSLLGALLVVDGEAAGAMDDLEATLLVLLERAWSDAEVLSLTVGALDGAARRREPEAAVCGEEAGLLLGRLAEVLNGRAPYAPSFGRLLGTCRFVVERTFWRHRRRHLPEGRRASAADGGSGGMQRRLSEEDRGGQLLVRLHDTVLPLIMERVGRTDFGPIDIVSDRLAFHLRPRQPLRAPGSSDGHGRAREGRVVEGQMRGVEVRMHGVEVRVHAVAAGSATIAYTKASLSMRLAPATLGALDVSISDPAAAGSGSATARAGRQKGAAAMAADGRGAADGQGAGKEGLALCLRGCELAVEGREGRAGLTIEVDLVPFPPQEPTPSLEARAGTGTAGGWRVVRCTAAVEGSLALRPLGAPSAYHLEEGPSGSEALFEAAPKGTHRQQRFAKRALEAVHESRALRQALTRAICDRLAEAILEAAIEG